MKQIPRIHPVLTILLCVAVLAADYWTGPDISFPIASAIPVALVSWHSRAGGLAIAAALSAARIAINVAWHLPFSWFEMAANFVIRVLVLGGLAYLVSAMAALTREVRMLRGILPICSNCKRIRLENGDWQQVESYISGHSEAEFSHGLCPDCAVKLYPQYAGKLKR